MRALAVSIFLSAACSLWAAESSGRRVAESRPVDPPRIRLQTSLGNIDLELDPTRAPLTTSNFLRYVRSGFYDGGLFHRTVTLSNQPANKVKIEVIQGAADPARSAAAS